jgi:uncharacterized protein (AIM24 family)
MAYCSNCGSEIKPGAAFCGNCGTPVKQKVAADPAPVAQPSGSLEFDVVRKERLNMVKIDLINSAVRYEAGALHYMKGDLELKTNMPSVGKFFKSMVTREKIIKPVISGSGTIFLNPSFGEFTILELQNDEWILDRGAYYASELGIEIGAFTNKAISALFSGEKWFQTVVAGTGKVVIISAGPLEEIELRNEKLVVDGRFAVARTSGVDLNVKRISKGIFSSVISGEGLVNTFTGTGKVLISPVDNYMNTLVNIVQDIQFRVSQPSS